MVATMSFNTISEGKSNVCVSENFLHVVAAFLAHLL